MKHYLLALFVMAQPVFLFANASARDCGNDIQVNENGVITGGTFMVALVGNEYDVISYIPTGTIVKVNGYEVIRKRRKGLKPKEECYYHVTTNLGKSGFLLQTETRRLSDYQGEYIFPRTEVNIYKEPSLEKVTAYLAREIDKKEIFLSSVAPKQRKQLKVDGITDDELFYRVSADFLGIQGYFLVSDVQKGLAAIVDTDNVSFGSHAIRYRGDGFMKIMEALLPAEAYEDLQARAKDVVSNIELSICKMPITLTFEAGVEFDTWWVDAGVSADGQIEIKTAKRTYRYEEHDIDNNQSSGTIKISKSIVCDDDGILYPKLVKFKFGDDRFEMRREGFRSIKPLLRTESDIAVNDSFSKILVIRGYLDWIRAYNHLDAMLQPHWAELDGHYAQVLDLLIDSISHYPSSEKREKST